MADGVQKSKNKGEGWSILLETFVLQKFIFKNDVAVLNS
jgi:hypothetical protein